MELVLSENIAEGRLPKGLVLVEGPIAEQLNVSRAPVKAALSALHKSGKITRFKGRGYLVGNSAGTSPIRKRVDETMLHVSPQMADALSKQGTWEHFVDEVELEIVSCQIFGRFQVLEEGLSDHLSVSRTVAREILGRLQERGLVTKKRGSQWVTGPLTSETIRHIFEIRRLLEPSVILEARESWNLEDLRQAGEAIFGEKHELWDVLSKNLSDLIFSRLNNPILEKAIYNRRSLLDLYHRGLLRLGLPVFRLPAHKYSEMLLSLGDGNRKAAAELFREILNAEEEMYVARMKIVGVLQEKVVFAPYIYRADGVPGT
ncbi:GntR family transcriptional regulator [Pararhodobacter sp.]|uniref:GntR family transcriptional regulator n=1 Tax=Pararhodobacter sp. TaxID=2127056 RepID=UPI002AFF8ECE|nr:GntR family transcriptional regulator [Pararhodobacter sp.]